MKNRLNNTALHINLNISPSIIIDFSILKNNDSVTQIFKNIILCSLFITQRL